jgi:hypothetical protein
MANPSAAAVVDPLSTFFVHNQVMFLVEFPDVAHL